jgi:CheY-like chemotaxis protein
VTQLERLVEDLLDAQRLQRGTLSLRLAHLDLRAVIEQSIEAITPLLEGKRQQLELELDKEPLAVFGDQARLVQILFNLLNNASRYSSAGAIIHLRAMKWGRQVEVSVSDHGIGIAEENLERVFHMFEQGSTGGNTEGLGIGLALVRQLVVLHGGKVVVSSPGVGSGATFGIQLPSARMPAVEEPASGTVKRASQPEAERGDRKSAAELRAALFERCVVVDDDVDTAETLALMLQSWGMTVNVAHDAGEALEAVQRTKPELVLLDLTLPGQERFALIEQLRSKIGREVRIVAVTGHADDDVRRQALEHGFDDLLVKPVSLEQLAAAASRQVVDLSSAQVN